jgi:gamma-glutamyltranspeptidase/glutathione hydrolase
LPAIRLALQGFPISYRMWSEVAVYATIPTALPADANARAYFLNPDGSAKPPGTILTNPDYAAVLLAVAFEGLSAFYDSQIAQDIVNTVQNDNRPGGRGLLSVSDLQNYQVVERQPVCGPYRSYVVCSMGPPSSGGIGELQILGMLSRFSLASHGPNSVATIHYFLQADSLAFADRNVWVGDPDFVQVPTAGLVDQIYLGQRAQLITSGPLTTFPELAGTPPGAGTPGQIAPRRNSHAVRLARGRPGPGGQPGARGPRAQACRQTRLGSWASRPMSGDRLRVGYQTQNRAVAV